MYPRRVRKVELEIRAFRHFQITQDDVIRTAQGYRGVIIKAQRCSFLQPDRTGAEGLAVKHLQRTTLHVHSACKIIIKRQRKRAGALLKQLG